jgi:hypothetical protein
MADLRRDPPSADDDDQIGMPVWVKVFAGIAVVLVLLFIVMHLAGGGMGRHMGS